MAHNIRSKLPVRTFYNSYLNNMLPNCENLFITFICLLCAIGVTSCASINVSKGLKETYIIRYYEDQKITPVKVELDAKEQTEHVTILNRNTSWVSVSFHDFKAKKVAYKDKNGSYCFIADLAQETLEDDRRRLKELNVNSGIVKGFYIPTFFILKEIENATTIFKEFGKRMAEFCNGSAVAYVTKSYSLLTRNKREVPNIHNNGQRGQFTHHSYGHYGHQSNNYAHYGHDTYVTGNVDKDGTIKDQNMSQYQERSHGSQSLPLTGEVNRHQVQTNGRSSLVNPHHSPITRSSFGNNAGEKFGTGSKGQFSFQTTQESGYQINLPLGLKGDNTYRSGISTRRQHDSAQTQQVAGPFMQGHPGSSSPDTLQTRHPVSFDIRKTSGHRIGRERGEIPIHYPQKDIDGTEQHIRPSPTSFGLTDHHPSFSGVQPRGHISDQITSSSRQNIDGFSSRPGAQGGTEVSGHAPGLQNGITSPGINIYRPQYVPGTPSVIRTIGYQPVSPPESVIKAYKPDTQRESALTSSQPGFVITDYQPGTYPQSTITGYQHGPAVTRYQLAPTITENMHGSSMTGYEHGIQPGSSITSYQPKSTAGYQHGTSITGHQSYTQPSSTIDRYHPRTQPGIMSTGYKPGAQSGSTIITYQPGATQSGYESGIQPGFNIRGYQPGTHPGPAIDGYQPITQLGVSANRYQPGTQPLSVTTRHQPGTHTGGLIYDSLPISVTGITPDISPGSIRPEYQAEVKPRSLHQIPVPLDQQPSPIFPVGPVFSRDQQPSAGIHQVSPIRSTISSTPSLSEPRQQGYPGYIQGTSYYPAGSDERYKSEVSSHTSLERSRTIGSGDSASSQTQIKTGTEGTAAEAASAGQFRGLGSQTRVQGGYVGNGSFSAQAQSGFTGGMSQSQVIGGNQGGLSGSSANVENVGLAQSQVQIGKPSGSASSSAQGRFSRGRTNVNVQSGRSGGSAGAEAQSSGLSSSQVQVNIVGEDTEEKNGFQGTVSASVYGSHSSAKSQTQLQGGYNSGRTYVASAQGGFDAGLDFQGSVPLTGTLTSIHEGMQDLQQTPQVQESGIIPIDQIGSAMTPGVRDASNLSQTPYTSSAIPVRNGQPMRPSYSINETQIPTENNLNTFDVKTSQKIPLQHSTGLQSTLYHSGANTHGEGPKQQTGSSHYGQKGLPQFPSGPGNAARDSIYNRQIYNQGIPTRYLPHQSSSMPVSTISEYKPGEEQHRLPGFQHPLATFTSPAGGYQDGIAHNNLQKLDINKPRQSESIHPRQQYFPQTSRNITTVMQPDIQTQLRQYPSHQLPMQPLSGYKSPVLYPQLPSLSQSVNPNNYSGLIHQSHPSAQKPTYQSNLPSSQNAFQQHTYTSVPYQPSLHFQNSIAENLPEGVTQTSPAMAYFRGATDNGDSRVAKNGHQEGGPAVSSNEQSPKPGTPVPDTNGGNCCDPLKNLKKQSSRRNGSCCSSSAKDFFTDFNTDEDDASAENSNSEQCKVVKAICYIVYKPVGKARICKPTNTNVC